MDTEFVRKICPASNHVDPSRKKSNNVLEEIVSSLSSNGVNVCENTSNNFKKNRITLSLKKTEGTKPNALISTSQNKKKRDSEEDAATGKKKCNMNRDLKRNCNNMGETKTYYLKKTQTSEKENIAYTTSNSYTDVQINKYDALNDNFETENIQICDEPPPVLFSNSLSIFSEKEKTPQTDSSCQMSRKVPSDPDFNKLENNSEAKIDLWLNDSTISEAYNKEIDVLFDKVENTICELGPNVHIPTENVVPNTSLNNINWNDDSFVTSAIINMSMDNERTKSFGSVIKKALLENAKKYVKPEVAINKTIIETESFFKSLGTFYGLPDKVQELLRIYRGIEKLYDWQDECLKLPAIENRKNLIYALPTSGGKTLVAEILMLREVLCWKRNALLVLPFVAIVQEKVWSLSTFAVALDFLVEEYASSKGTYPPRKRRRKNSIYVATIEKALGLINSLYETGRINEIGLVVVDELHLIGDQGRGATLEALLTKLVHAGEQVQIVGMSATIGNLSDICTFLNADVYTRNFRPVELTEYVKCNNEVAKINWNAANENEILSYARTISFKYSDHLKQIDPDRLGGLVMEVVPKDSCLVFCASKKSCENVALLLCRVLFSSLKNHKKSEKEQLKVALNNESGSLCKILNMSLDYGVAYHHSGLTSEERRLIEEGFRSGIISVICCTSTLAAGVNLPAKRVILRKPYIGKDFINLSRYKQMVGRAGRAGLGETGESILICDSTDLPKVQKLLMSPMDEALSSLHEDKGKGLRHLLLSCVSLGMSNNRNQLHMVSNKTLMSVQQKRLDINVKKLTDEAIKELFKMGALHIPESKTSQDPLSNVSINLETTQCSATQIENFDRQRIVVTSSSKLIISKLGSAAIKGGLELASAHTLYEDLLEAQKHLVLLNDLHLLYLVIPYDYIFQIKPNFTVYYNIFTKLNSKELHTAKILGLDESVGVKMLSNRLLKSVPEKIVNRFYLTLILYDLWNEKQVFEVAEKFQVDRGLVQNLMTSSATFASNTVSFCEELEEFWAFVHLLKGMSQRLSHCCIKEIMPLMELPSVKQSRARQLYNAGYKTLQKIASANPRDLVENIEFMSNKVANQLIAAAKMLLLEKVENLREEAQDVLEGIETDIHK